MHVLRLRKTVILHHLTNKPLRQVRVRRVAGERLPRPFSDHVFCGCLPVLFVEADRR